jgi:PAS domain S-box-containing protein
MPYTIVMSFYGQNDSRALIEDAVQAAGMAWWLMELPTGAIFFSPEKVKMLGRTDIDNFVHYNDFMNLVHPDDKEHAMQAMADHLEGRKEYYETAYRIQYSDGTYKVFYDRGRITGRKGKEIAVTGIVTDTTKMKAILHLSSKIDQAKKTNQITGSLT